MNMENIYRIRKYSANILVGEVFGQQGNLRKNAKYSKISFKSLKYLQKDPLHAK